MTTTSKNNWFYEQNNRSAHASRFLVHFFGVHCTTTICKTPDNKCVVYSGCMSKSAWVKTNHLPPQKEALLTRKNGTKNFARFGKNGKKGNTSKGITFSPGKCAPGWTVPFELSPKLPGFPCKWTGNIGNRGCVVKRAKFASCNSHQRAVSNTIRKRTICLIIT